MGSSTESPSGKVRAHPPAHFGTPLTRIAVPQGTPPNAPAARSACAPPLISAHLSRGSWP
eukprot:878103-Pyramimonas_sp.AAC.1